MDQNEMRNDYPYYRRHSKRTIQRRRRRRRLVIVLTAALLVVCLSAGGTLAFLLTRTETTKNVFSPGKVACEVTETFTDNVKSNVAVQNTGNTDAYIRAAINVTWMKNDTNAGDQTVTAKVPQQGRDYTMSLSVNSGWLQETDGYWYYTIPVAPGASTGTLIDECKLLPGAEVPEGYHLSVEIISSAIQSSPAEVVQGKWHVVLDASGTITGSGVTGE